MTKTAELTHLFRALKAPAAARAVPKLAERAREEEWSHEKFLEAVLSTEVSSRESHGGENRIKAAHFPARKTLEEFDFTFQRTVKKQVVEHLGQLDFLHGKENVVLLGPPGTGKTHLGIALGIRACLAGQRVQFATPTEWVARLGEEKRSGQLEAELRRLSFVPLLVVDEVGYIPFDPEAANMMFSLVSARYERLPDCHLEQALFGLGRDLRRRSGRCGDDRSPGPPRRDPRTEGRQLPAQGQGPGLSAAKRLSAPACSASPYGLGSTGGTLAFGLHSPNAGGGPLFNRQKVVRFSTGVDSGALRTLNALGPGSLPAPVLSCCE
jgi:DNA replication protein DnaC